ncbi:hypothetical protein Tco_1127911 [Tanacetum coccineum]
MLVIQAAEGEGLRHPSEPQPPPFTAQPINKEPILTTSEPIPNVPDEAVYEEWDDRVGRATTAAASLDAVQASGGSLRCQEAMGGSIAQTRSEKVKKLEQITKTRQARRRAKIIVSVEIQGRHGQEMEFETEVYTTKDVSAAGAAVTTVGASISNVSPPRVSTAEDISIAETLVYIRRSAAKDKAAVRLQEQLDEEERKRIDKHMGSHTLQQLKRLSFDELKNLFKATMRRVGVFVPMETKIRREVHELAAGILKRDVEEELD